MSDVTLRDRVWLVVIDALRDHKPIKTDDITDRVDVSSKTARAVLRVAEEEGLLRRASPRAQTWYPDIGPLGDLEKEEYQQLLGELIRDLDEN